MVFQCESLLLVLEHRFRICSSVVRVSWQTVSMTRSAICVTVKRFISILKSGLLASRPVHTPWYFFVGGLLFLSMSFLLFRLDCSLHLTSPSQQGKQLFDLQINPKLLSQEGSLWALKQTHSILCIYFFNRDIFRNRPCRSADSPQHLVEGHSVCQHVVQSLSYPAFTQCSPLCSCACSPVYSTVGFFILGKLEIDFSSLNFCEILTCL